MFGTWSRDRLKKLQTLSCPLPRPLPTIEGIGTMPWWAPLAGLTGAVAVFPGLAFIDKMGAGLVNGLIITTNLLTSLAIDHFGHINMPVHALACPYPFLILVQSWSEAPVMARPAKLVEVAQPGAPASGPAGLAACNRAMSAAEFHCRSDANLR